MSNLNINPNPAENPLSPSEEKKQKTALNSETGFLPHRGPKYAPVGENNVKVLVWELPVRIWHWVNALAIVVLMITGIYIGKPFVGATIPEEAYPSFLMGWARYIHFYAAFIFTANMMYRCYWVFVGNRYAASNPARIIFWKETWETIKFYLFFKHKKPHYVGHNPLAQLSYWLFIGAGSLIIMFTGYFLYFEPQLESFWGKMFIWVPFVFGGDSFTVRSWHHLVAWAFIVFTVIHVYLAWREDYLQRNGTMSSIVTGYKVEPKKYVGDDHEQ